MKYRYMIDIEGKKVICLTQFRGKTYRGISKCHPDDVFDEELGKKYARIRCDYKVALAKITCVSNEVVTAQEKLRVAQDELRKCEKYYESAKKQLSDTYRALASINVS